MKSAVFLLTAGLAIACASAAENAAPPNLHELMKNVVAVETQAIWDVTNNAMNDNGDPDPSKIKPADWARLSDAAGKVKAAAQKLATAPHVMAAAPGQKIEGEGSAPGAFGAKEVQKAMAANPKAFQGFAQQLAGSMDEIVIGSKTKNARKVFDVSLRLDQECEGCHKLFWYPNQR